MPSKSYADNRHPPSVIRLLDFGVVTVSGRDAADFLQRQTMNDLRELVEVGQWQWNGLLSPKGRVLALFALLRVDAQAFWLLLPDGDAAHWAHALASVVFRSKLTVEPRPDLHATGLIEIDGLPAVRANRALQDDGGWWLDFGSAHCRRLLHVGATTPAMPQPLAISDDRSPWHCEDLRHGLPHLPPERRDSHTPQMLALERLAAFSVKKGCYPGQEIVARTHFLGQAKRRLRRLVGSQPFGDAVLCGGQRFALFDRARCGDLHEALAMLPVDAGEPVTTEDGSAVELRPFLDGLARHP